MYVKKLRQLFLIALSLLNLIAILKDSAWPFIVEVDVEAYIASV